MTEDRRGANFAWRIEEPVWQRALNGIRATGDRNRMIWTAVTGGATTPRIENTGQQNHICKADWKPVSP